MSNSKSVRYQNHVLINYFGHEPKKGEVGIEIECVGLGIPTDIQLHKTWTVHQDGSLRPRRNETAIEYVLATPTHRDEVGRVMDRLHEEFKRVGHTPAEDRDSTSVHIHLNAQQLTFKQVYTWLTLYFILEEILVHYAGPQRKGNLFCLRAADAEFLVQQLIKISQQDHYADLNNDNLRYASANVCALAKYGSLEFRCLRGTTDKKLITDWVSILTAIKDASMTFKDPREVCESLSKLGPDGLFNKIFSGKFPELIDGFDWRSTMFDGVRLAQDIAYNINWVVGEPDKKPVQKPAYQGWSEVADDPEENPADMNEYAPDIIWPHNVLRYREAHPELPRPSDRMPRGYHWGSGPNAILFSGGQWVVYDAGESPCYFGEAMTRARRDWQARQQPAAAPMPRPRRHAFMPGQQPGAPAVDGPGFRAAMDAINQIRREPHPQAVAAREDF